MILLFTTTGFADGALKATHQYMVDLNKYFVIDASRDGLFGINPVASIANGLFKMHKWFIKLVAGLIELSYSFDLYNIIEKQFNAMFMPVKKTFFDGFFPVAGAIFILAIFLMVGIGGRVSEGFENFIKGMGILVFALWFMKNPANSMSTIKNITDIANAELIKATVNSEQLDPKTQYKMIGDAFYTNNVVEIWRILNFSANGIDDPSQVEVIRKKYETQLLSQAPGSQEREETVNKLREEVVIDEGSVLFTILIVMILSLPDLAVMLLLSGVNFVSDALTLLLAMIAPVVFIFALIPAYGTRLIMSWISKIMYFFGLTIGTTILLTYYLSFSKILLDNQEALFGLIGVYFVKAVVIVMIYLFREKLKFAYSAVGHGKRGVERGVREMGLEREAEMVKSHTMNRAQSSFYDAKSGVQKEFKKQMKKRSASDTVKPVIEQEETKVMDENSRRELAEKVLESRLKKQMHQAKQTSVEMEDTFGIQFEPDYGKWTEKVNKYEAGSDPFTGSERREMINDIYLLEKSGKDPHSLLEKTKVNEPTRMNQEERREHAEKILENQLQARIEKANLKAAETDTAPEYDAYTVERMRRKNTGEQVFDEKEIKTVADGIKKYEKTEQDPKRLIKRRSADYIDPDSEDGAETEMDDSTNEAPQSEQTVRTVEDEVHHNVKHTYKHYKEGDENKDQSVEDSGSDRQNERQDKQTDIRAVRTNRLSNISSREELHKEIEQRKDFEEMHEGIQDIKRVVEDQGRGINDRLKKVEGEGNEKAKDSE